MKFAQFNDQHELCARYDSEIHGDNIPADAVEISDELFWQTINEADGVWKRDPETGEISKHPLPPTPPKAPRPHQWQATRPSSCATAPTPARGGQAQQRLRRACGRFR